MNLKNVIYQPVLTEKAMTGQEEGCYAFWVNPKAAKSQIRTAVEKLFEVKPTAVRTARIGNKKKAYIQLEKGEKITIAGLGE